MSASGSVMACVPPPPPPAMVGGGRQGRAALGPCAGLGLVAMLGTDSSPAAPVGEHWARRRGRAQRAGPYPPGAIAGPGARQPHSRERAWGSGAALRAVGPAALQAERVMRRVIPV